MVLQPAYNCGEPCLHTTMKSLVKSAAVGDATLINSSSPKNLSASKGTTSCLANEILLEVCSHLGKSDLRSVRLANKHFSQIAAESLFETVYISPSIQDIDVFTKITQRPALARCIQTLAYDVSTFKRFGIALYRTLWISYFRRLLLRRQEIVHPTMHTNLKLSWTFRKICAKKSWMYMIRLLNKAL